MQIPNLKDVGLKVTTPRLKILELLEENTEQHFSAEDIYTRLKENGEDIGLATIYRVLTQFEEAGIVCRHRFEDGRAIFELNTGEHHDHIVCLQCGKVEEFVDEIIEKRQREIAQQAGFEMTDHCLYIYGLCGQCQSKK
ncbi:MAG: ferric iron uptake transcriptional regulator [Gammaproteobacteria bacterium]|nr:ferric iron uptake transcriptional regulator [Gammaproteobacteria bacterium]